MKVQIMQLTRVMMLLILSCCSIVFAQIPVIDRIPVNESKPQTVVNTAKNNQQSELYYQIQLLQQEVLQLRGLIEQQAYELKKVKQQRLEDYMELDRRLSQQPTSSGSSSSVIKRVSTNTDPSISPVTLANESESSVIDPQVELKQYREAIDLVLKKKDYEQAKSALNQHLVEYPSGRYAANSHYWLGEIHLQQKNLDDAENWFSSLLQKFPAHSKVEDTKFKLAQVYFEKGDKERAKSLLDAVATSDKSVAELAKSYLDKHFPEY